jgi:4'-phosphopantetheinyl transferase
MPLYLEKRINGSRLAVWQMTETEQELFSQTALSEEVKSEVENFRSEKRRKEWLTLRILLKDVLGVAQYDDIVYDEKGKPHLKNGNGYISFSHTRSFAAVMFHRTKNIGIDIETVRERIEKVSHKFLSDEEQAFTQHPRRMDMLHIIWGAKEVMFKIYGKGGLDFKNQMRVHPFIAGDGDANAELRIDNIVSRYKIEYFFAGNLVVVYAVS